MATKEEKQQWVKEAIEAMHEAKAILIGKGGQQVSKHIFSEILEIEGFPSDAEQIHPVEEEKLFKAIFYAHAHAADSIFNTVIRMIEYGVLEPNGNMAKKVAQKLRHEQEIDDVDNMELEPDEDDDNEPYHLEDEE